MEYLPLPLNDARAALIRQMWRDRIQGTKRKVEVGVHKYIQPDSEWHPAEYQTSNELSAGLIGSTILLVMGS